jgi:2-methylisocitrate lyase-like PEP mutase family enzyme
MVEGGHTPLLTANELENIGYKVAIFPGGLVRAQTYTTQKFFNQLMHDGTTSNMLDRMNSFQELNDIIGTNELLSLGKKYAAMEEDDE